MLLHIEGGCGEHGRNSFLIQGRQSVILLDCGVMQTESGTIYPRLFYRDFDFSKIDVLFLSHSHNDHVSAIPELIKRGFRGKIVASRPTFEQLPFSLNLPCLALEEIAPDGQGKVDDVSIQWGRTGHCPGAVWYALHFEDKRILYSGDYVEKTQVYRNDPIRQQKADLAILDTDYAYDAESYEGYCAKLLQLTRECLESGPVFFPVPKYGRGLEIYQLLKRQVGLGPFFGDTSFRQEISRVSTAWCKQDLGPVSAISEELETGIYFLSSSQLAAEDTRNTAQKLLAKGAVGIATGLVEPRAYTKELYDKGKLLISRYPVHMSYPDWESILKENDFKKIVHFSSPAFSYPLQIRI